MFLAVDQHGCTSQTIRIFQTIQGEVPEATHTQEKLRIELPYDPAIPLLGFSIILRIERGPETKIFESPCSRYTESLNTSLCMVQRG